MNKLVASIATALTFLSASAFAQPELCYSLDPALTVNEKKVSKICFGTKHTYNDTIDVYLMGEFGQLLGDYHFSRSSEDADWITLSSQSSSKAVLEITWEGPHFPTRSMKGATISSADGTKAKLTRTED